MSFQLKALEIDKADASYALRHEHRNVINAFLTTAGTAYPYAVPSGAKKVFFSSTGDFYAKFFPANEFGVLTTGLVTGGTMASATPWTLGDGLAIGSGVATWDASQAEDSDLEQDVTDNSLVLVEGRRYLVTFTVTAYTAGNVVPVIGGTEGTDRGSAATFAEEIVAGASQVIALRGDADADLSVDNFTIIPIADIPAADDVTHGEGSTLNPTVRIVESAGFISLVPAANSTIVTMAFYKDR